MDKNIAAILREDTRTVGIVFNASRVSPVTVCGAKVQPRPISAEYTYVTDLKLSIGDAVVVPVGDDGDIKVAYVSRVDEDLEIEPNSDIKFKWVVSKINMDDYLKSEARNAEIERGLANIYRTNARRAFAQQLLAGADEKLLALVKGN